MKIPITCKSFGKVFLLFCSFGSAMTEDAAVNWAIRRALPIVLNPSFLLKEKSTGPLKQAGVS